MPDPNLVAYITASLKAGKPVAEIRTELLQTGWPDAAVNEALAPYSRPDQVVAETSRPASTLPTSPVNRRLTKIIKYCFGSLSILYAAAVITLLGTLIIMERALSAEHVVSLAPFISMVWILPVILFFMFACGLISLWNYSVVDHQTSKSWKMALFSVLGLIFLELAITISAMSWTSEIAQLVNNY